MLCHAGILLARCSSSTRSCLERPCRSRKAKLFVHPVGLSQRILVSHELAEVGVHLNHDAARLALLLDCCGGCGVVDSVGCGQVDAVSCRGELLPYTRKASYRGQQTILFGCCLNGPQLCRESNHFKTSSTITGHQKMMMPADANQQVVMSAPCGNEQGQVERGKAKSQPQNVGEDLQWCRHKTVLH